MNGNAMNYGRRRFEPQLSPEVEQLATQVIGAAIEVHRALGPGLTEDLYEQALCIELAIRHIPYVCQHRVAVHYKGEAIGERRLDLIVDQKLIVENKAVEALSELERKQALTYLRITGLPLCLLINYNTVTVKDGIRRVILSEKASSSRPSRSSRLRASGE